MTINLPSNISSIQDVKTMIQEIQNYARWFASESIKTKVTGIKPAANLTVSETAGFLIQQAANGQQLSGKILDELILTLEKLVANSPRVTVTLAAVAPGGLKKQMVEWFRANTAPEILVDFKFNATILGGMVVQYGSHIHDWSFRRAILQNRQKFPEILRHV